MNWKYIKNIDKKANFAEIFIYDEIAENKVNGVNFAYELSYLLQYENVKEVKIRINSIGGSVLQGFSIISAILNAKKNYPNIAVNTYNDGIAASIAGVIWAAGHTRYMKDYARLMVHGVSIPDSDAAQMNENDKTALEHFKDMIVEAFVGTTGIVASYINDLLTNKKDNWFTSKDCIANGFIIDNNIENTGVKISKPETFTALAFQNKAIEIINNLKPITMKKVIAKLGLQEAASEEAQISAIEAIENRANQSAEALLVAQNELQVEKDKNAALSVAIGVSNDAAALALVENSIKEGKFDPTKKDELIATAKKDIEAFKNMLSFMPIKAKNILDGFETGENGAKSLIEKIANRSFRELEKTDAALLATLKAENKAEYAKLYNTQYGTNKTETDF
jgi:ATP-dependent protease ClpP protease subunit